MSTFTQSYDELVARLEAWAAAEANIRAVVVIGSRARADHPADEWSDLDLLLFADDPAPYWEDGAWLRHLGSPLLSFVEPTSDRRTIERRVLFDSGCDVDIVPIPAEALRGMFADGIPPYMADIVARGVRVLLDKDGMLGILAQPAPPRPLPPAVTSAEFGNLVSDFWYHTVWVAKHLRRGELWYAKSGNDMYLKELLLRMLEWHARARGGQRTDTWMRGRFLEQWADRRAVAALPAVFARYDGEEVWLALLATMDLFRWVSLEAAEALGFASPAAGMEGATALVRELYEGRG